MSRVQTGIKRCSCAGHSAPAALLGVRRCTRLSEIRRGLHSLTRLHSEQQYDLPLGLHCPRMWEVSGTGDTCSSGTVKLGGRSATMSDTHDSTDTDDTERTVPPDAVLSAIRCHFSEYFASLWTPAGPV